MPFSKFGTILVVSVHGTINPFLVYTNSNLHIFIFLKKTVSSKVTFQKNKFINPRLNYELNIHYVFLQLLTALIKTNFIELNHPSNSQLFILFR